MQLVMFWNISNLTVKRTLSKVKEIYCFIYLFDALRNYYIQSNLALSKNMVKQVKMLILPMKDKIHDVLSRYHAIMSCQDAFQIQVCAILFFSI